MTRLALSLPILASALALHGGSPGATPLVVKASAVAAPCVAAAAAPFETASGRRVSVLTAVLGPRSSATGADVVVGADEELTRSVEGGASDPEAEKDIARIPWVFVGVSASPDLRALERPETRVRVLAGIVGRQARESLERLPAERVLSATSASGLRPQGTNEIALVPLSLAGNSRVTSSSVEPLQIRAVAAAESRQREAARAFVEFLAGRGNAAFRRCGRDPR